MFKQFVNLIDIERFDSFIVLRDDVIIQPYRKIDKLVNNSIKGYVTSIWDWEAEFMKGFTCVLAISSSNYLLNTICFNLSMLEMEKLIQENIQEKKLHLKL